MNAGKYLNLTALSALFVGYLLTTGTGIIESSLLQHTFRVLAVSIAVMHVALAGRVNLLLLLLIVVTVILFSLNQSTIALNLIFLLLISASVRLLSEQSAAWNLFLSSALVVTIHLVLFSAGALSIGTYEVGERVRAVLGFANPNQAAIIYLSLVVGAAFLYATTPSWRTLALFVSSAVVAAPPIFLTGSRTSLFALGALIIGQITVSFVHRGRFFSAAIRFVGFFSPLLAAGLSVLILASADYTLDDLLSARPWFFAQFIQDVKFHELMLGWNTQGRSEVDNVYLMLLSACGAVGSIIVILALSVGMLTIPTQRIPIAVVLLVAGIFEAFLIRPELPASVILLALFFTKCGLPHKNNILGPAPAVKSFRGVHS